MHNWSFRMMSVICLNNIQYWAKVLSPPPTPTLFEKGKIGNRCRDWLSCWKMKLFLVRRFPNVTAWWIKIWWPFYIFIIPSTLTRSPIPLFEIQPQTITEPPLWLTDECSHSLLSWTRPYILTMIWTKIILDLYYYGLHKTSRCWFSVQFVCNLSYLNLLSLFPFPKNSFHKDNFFTRFYNIS